MSRLPLGHRINPWGPPTLVMAPSMAHMGDVLRNMVEMFSRNLTGKYIPVRVAYPVVEEHANEEPSIEVVGSDYGGRNCVLVTTGPGTLSMLGLTPLLLANIVGCEATRAAIATLYTPLIRSHHDEKSKNNREHRIMASAPTVWKSFRDATGDLGLSKWMAFDLHCKPLTERMGWFWDLSMTGDLVTRALLDASYDHPDLPIVIVYADDGSADRAAEGVAALEADLRIRYAASGRQTAFPKIVAAKMRIDSHKIEILGYSGPIEALRGALVFVIDDEILKGNTSVQTAAKMMKEFGAEVVWLIVTHPVFHPVAPALLMQSDCPAERVYVSDTIPRRPFLAPMLESGKLVVESCVPRLAEALTMYFQGLPLF